MKRIYRAALAAVLLLNTANVFAQGTGAAAPPEDPNTPSEAVQGVIPDNPSADDSQTPVAIALLSELPDDATPVEMTEDEDQLAALHASVAENAAVKAKLDAGGYAVDDVVAMANNVDGSITVYVDDRP